MRKLLFLFSVIVSMMCFTSCENGSVAKLKRVVSETNKQCPIDLGIVGEIRSINYDDQAKEVELNCSLNEDIVSIDDIKGNNSMAVNNIKLSLARDEAKEMLSLMVEAKAGISLTYIGTESGQPFTVALSPDDIKELMDSPLSDTEIYQLMFDNQIAMENSRLPLTIEEGMTMTKMYDGGDKIIYEYELDEEIYDISNFKYNDEDVKESIAYNIQQDPTLSQFIGMLRSLNKGLTYRYIGDMSGDIGEIEFTPAELGRFTLRHYGR